MCANAITSATYSSCSRARSGSGRGAGGSAGFASCGEASAAGVPAAGALAGSVRPATRSERQPEMHRTTSASPPQICLDIEQRYHADREWPGAPCWPGGLTNEAMVRWPYRLHRLHPSVCEHTISQGVDHQEITSIILAQYRRRHRPTGGTPMMSTKSMMICALAITGGCALSESPDESETEQAATPCSVPSFIAGAPSPAGWASVSGGTTGGGAGTQTLVTTLAAFNTAAAGTNPAVIFVSGRLAQGTASIGSNKTIIGCSGTNPTLSGHVRITSVTNVIVRNMNIVGFNCAPPDVDITKGGECQNGQDAITVQSSRNI